MLSMPERAMEGLYGGFQSPAALPFPASRSAGFRKRRLADGADGLPAAVDI